MLFQRLLAGSALAALLASPAAPAFAALSDAGSSPYAEAIRSLEAKGVVAGYADGTFKPGNRINRAEFLKIVLEAAYGNKTILETSAQSKTFPDVTLGDWFAPYVRFGANLGVIGGYPDGLFHPERDINFVEASKIVSLAFKQQLENRGGEWYEPYARALDASKAIPTSIAKFDSALTRGEMAEILWRLTENRTDLAAKGFLNLKHPEAQVNFASDDVQVAKSCADLQAFAAEAGQGGGNGMMYYRRGEVMEDAAEAGAPAPSAANKTALPLTGGGADGDYSKTNVQVEGVDEADTVKTDGTYLYMLRDNEVKIVRALPANDLRVVSTLTVAKEGFQPSEMFVDSGRLVVIGNRWNAYPMPMVRDMGAKMIAPDMYPYPGGGNRTDVKIYDVKDPSKPSLLRELSFEGSSVSSRRVGDKVYLVLQQPMRWRGPVILEKEIMPLYSDSAKGSADMVVAPCGRVAILPHVPAPQYMTVAVIPTDSVSKAVSTDVVLGDAQNVYMSADNLYVATTEWNYVWDSANPGSTEKTNVFRFAVTSDGVDFAAKGSVPGHILNQFSMDEHEDHFRIATTDAQVWMEDSAGGDKAANNLYVLDRGMKTVGQIEDIAPGESIYSVRFMGDRTYMVTFKQVDPLFVIDTSNPRAPKILGKLKIPGYSNYLHPLDATHVLGFGKEVDESIDKDKVHSDDAVYYTAIQGMKISIFDVSDVENPKEQFKEVIGDRGTESPLLTDHKALLFDAERGLLAFPILVTKRAAGVSKSEAGSPVFQGAYVYDVSLSKGFSLRGTITHYAADAMQKAGDYWYGGGRDISRIVRIGESLYTLSHDAVMSNTEKTLAKQGSVELGAK